MSPQRTLISQMGKHIGETIQLFGRVISIREVGSIRFADIQDRSGRGQIVIGPETPLPKLQSIISCSGVVVKSVKSFTGFEVHAEKITIISSPLEECTYNPEDITSPLSNSGPSLEKQLECRHLSIRASSQQAIIKITSEVLFALSDFLRKQDFTEIKTPKLVSAGAEGGSGMFEVKYFDRLMYLSQSPQLYKQTLASSPLERFFEIAPVFRFEKHSTSRHLNEFTGVDVEFAFPKNLEEVMLFEIEMIRWVIKHLEKACSMELKLLGASLPEFPEEVPMISLSQAKELLTGKKPSRTKPAVELSPREEAELCQWALEEHGSDTIAVHSYPAATRPFYIMPHKDNSRLSQSYDLLMRGVEMSSGGIRVHDIGTLEFNMKRKGLEISDFGFYKEIFENACPPHGGFGIGLERLVQKLLGFANVREASLFVRDRQKVCP